jgi:hypothetical protein
LCVFVGATYESITSRSKSFALPLQTVKSNEKVSLEKDFQSFEAINLQAPAVSRRVNGISFLDSSFGYKLSVCCHLCSVNGMKLHVWDSTYGLLTEILFTCFG